ncbi:MAG: metallophosphoesterase family protein, partial [Chitinivibrionales bacterium]|nr:metallophosphoesterase family protein [Chitinivibrionales bacterium]
MRLFIISDLHVAENETLSTFGWNQDDFIEKMEAIRKTHAVDKIILNGDIYDLFKSDFKAIADRKKKLIRYLSGEDFIYIKGNHDVAHRGAKDFYKVVNSKGESIHIEHGHRADFINGTALGRRMGYMFYQVLKLFTKLSIVRAMYYGYLERDEGLQDARAYRSYKYLRYAMRLLRKNNVVVLGHTHKVEIHNTVSPQGTKRYFNTGS